MSKTGQIEQWLSVRSWRETGNNKEHWYKNHLRPAADLGMFSMFGQTAAPPHKNGPPLDERQFFAYRK